LSDRGEAPPQEEGSTETEGTTEELSTGAEETTDDEGGVLGRRTVVFTTESSVCVTTTSGAEVSAGPTAFCAPSSPRAFPGTVTTTVAVLPSEAMLIDVLVTEGWSDSTSDSAFGGPASGSLLPVASMDAKVAQMVATSTPPAASSAIEDIFLSLGAADAPDAGGTCSDDASSAAGDSE
jgi:hypothetical protein